MTNSEARKRMQAQNPAESAPSIDGSPEPAPVDPAPLNGPLAANLGDGANGRLTEAERADVLSQVDRPTSQRRPQILAAVERIVREHTERAWDEAHDAFCLRSIVCSTHGRPGDRHRIYAARQEQDR